MERISAMKKKEKRRQIYTPKDKEALTAILSDAANRTPRQPRNMSMRALIEDLKDEIRHLRKMDYTIDEICELITEGGFEDIAQSTLRAYLSNAAGKRRQRRPKGAGKAGTAKVGSERLPELAKPANCATSAKADARAARRRSTLARFAATCVPYVSWTTTIPNLSCEHHELWGRYSFLNEEWEDLPTGKWQSPTTPPSALRSAIPVPQRRERRSGTTTDLEPSRSGARRSRTTLWGDPQRRSSTESSQCQRRGL